MSNDTSKGKGAMGASKQRAASSTKQREKGKAKTPAVGAKTLIGVGVACALLFAAFVAFTNKQAALLTSAGLSS